LQPDLFHFLNLLCGVLILTAPERAVGRCAALHPFRTRFGRQAAGWSEM